MAHRISKGSARQQTAQARPKATPSFSQIERLTIDEASVTRYVRSDGVEVFTYSDGRFEVHGITKDGLVLVGDCHTDRLSPRIISPPPNSWYADCNDRGPARTLRLYRKSKLGAPMDVCLFQYHSENSPWEVVFAKDDGPAALEYKEESRLRLPSLLSWLQSLLALLLRLLRLLLSPLADRNWRQKMLVRQFRSRLSPIETFDMPLENKLTLMGNHLNSLQLRNNGKVRINQAVYGLKDTNIVVMRKGLREDRPFVEWHGGILVVHDFPEKAYVTYENGLWRQWQLVSPDVSTAMLADFFTTVDIGRRFNRRAFISLVILGITLFVGLLILHFSFGAGKVQ